MAASMALFISRDQYTIIETEECGVAREKRGSPEPGLPLKP
jgi:hypothetical protein